MKEVTVEADGGQGGGGAPGVQEGGKGTVRPDIHNRAMKILRAREPYNGYEEVGEKPSGLEVMGWYLYEFCFYFVQTVLVPVVFPLIISQLQRLPADSLQEWAKTHPAKHCSQKEIHLYIKLTNHTIRTSGGSNFSALEWTSIAWATGLALAAPILGFISFHLDGHFPKLITAAATGIGVFFCLPAGFFKVTAIFIPYIAGIVAASTVATAAHTHHLGLMIRCFTGPTLKRSEFSIRQAVSGRLSLHATAAGCLGAAIISSFTYHMLRELNDNDRDVMSLWVVSIFSGLIWLVGVLHIVTAIGRTTDSISFSSRLHPFSIFKYPHAIGGLAGVFLSSFTTMSIFTGGVIFIVGQLCIKPLHLLYFWLTYFLFPLVSLSLLQPLLHVIKMNSVKMQIVGFLLSLLSSGFGFYYGHSHWKWGQKKSYASIVKVMKEGAVPSSTVTPVSVKSAHKSQEQQGTAAPPPSSISETNGSIINTNEVGNNQEAEAEGYSIYVKGLPPIATPALLENEFKKFGPIKSGGIQVRTQKGFSFGFVEFEVPSAVQSALEASPILINGRHIVVEEKRSTNRGNSRGRFSSGRAPGYRGEGARGRGNYGNGRSYGRGGDFNGRGEYGYRNGNRGGFSSRGGDGYQRNDHMGTGGGRMNRAGGSAVNPAVKTTGVRVPASA